MAERGNQMEIRFNQRMERSERRMDKFDRRMEAADRRGDKFDRKLEATRKLVEFGMKVVMQLGKRPAELEKSQKAFLDSLRRGGNGNGRKQPRA